MSVSIKQQYAKEAMRILTPYKDRFQQNLKTAYDRFGPNNNIRHAMQYALKSPGKRFRPALIYMIQEALQSSNDVEGAARAVEYFHTASLIADDLPCMDNDDFRRGVATTHKEFNEETAILASYALISAGFDEIARFEDSHVAQKAVLEASKQMGNMGLIGGQALDLAPNTLDKDEILEIIQLKTVALFDLSLSLGWLFSGGDEKKLDEVHALSHHFGTAFQIIDDLDDQQKDRDNNHPVNYANLFGVKDAVDTVEKHIEAFFASMKRLGIESKPLASLAEGLRVFSKSF